MRGLARHLLAEAAEETARCRPSRRRVLAVRRKREFEGFCVGNALMRNELRKEFPKSDKNNTKDIMKDIKVIVKTFLFQ